mgnify:CR=1 FL=1
MEQEVELRGSCERAASEPRYASSDHAAWIRQVVQTAMHMGIAMHNQHRRMADDRMISEGLVGIAEGAMQEILSIMSYRPPKVTTAWCPDPEAHGKMVQPVMQGVSG